MADSLLVDDGLCIGTAVARPPASADWASSRRRPRRLCGHPLRATDRRTVAVGPSEHRLLRRHGVAAAARLADSRRVGSPAPRTATAAERDRPARLVRWGRRRKPRPRASRRRVDRPITGRPRPRGLQASSGRRPSRRAAAGHADRRPSKRRHAAAPILDGIGAIAGRPGRPRQRPDQDVADRGYDHDRYRPELWRRGVKPAIARRGTQHGSGLGRVRWVVERLLSLGCALICWRRLER